MESTHLKVRKSSHQGSQVSKKDYSSLFMFLNLDKRKKICLNIDTI